MFGFYFYLFVLYSLCYCGLLLGVGFANCALFCLAGVWFVCLGTCLVRLICLFAMVECGLVVLLVVWVWLRCVGFVGLGCSAAVLLVVFRLGCCFLGLGGGVGFLVVSVVGCLHYCCGFLLFCVLIWLIVLLLVV